MSDQTSVYLDYSEENNYGFEAGEQPEEEGEGASMSYDNVKFPCFVNVYDIFQNKGGNEEGGWWFDSFAPQESVKIKNKETLDRVLAEKRAEYFLTEEGRYSLEDQYDHPDFDRERQRGYTSCAGGTSYCIKIQKGFAAYHPTERHHYE